MAALLADTCRVTSFPIQVYKDDTKELLNCFLHRHVKLMCKSDLNEMVDHERGDARSPPLRMHQQERDVSLVVFHIRHHEAKTNHDLLVKHHDTEVWVL